MTQKPSPKSGPTETQSIMGTCQVWWQLAMTPTVIRRGLAYAVIVGAILIAINHGDALVDRAVTPDRLWKMGLTVVVPYAVSTLSSVGAMRCSENENS